MVLALLEDDTSCRRPTAEEAVVTSRSFSRISGEVLQSIGRHRLVTAAHVRDMHAPGRSMNWVRRVLRELDDAGLVSSVTTRTRPSRLLYYLTPEGQKTISPSSGRVVQVTREGAAGALQAHTLAVNDVGVAFVRAARARGDECGPLAWHHEVAHSLGNSVGRRQMMVVSDAVLRYTLMGETADDGVRLLSRFVEVDRATKPLEDLVQQLRGYARLYSYAPNGSGPGWRATYPYGFPPVLLVFAWNPHHGPSPAWDRAMLQRRMNTVLAIVNGDGAIEAARELKISCCLLDDLVQDGPFAPVFVRHTDPTRYVGWLD